MSDTQILTLALAVIVPLSMLLYSNSRISDVRTSVNESRETLRTSVGEAKETLRAEMKAQHAELMAAVQELKGLLKVHELEHHH